MYRLKQHMRRENHMKESQTVAIHCARQQTSSLSGINHFDYDRKCRARVTGSQRPSFRGNKTRPSSAPLLKTRWSLQSMKPGSPLFVCQCRIIFVRRHNKHSALWHPDHYSKPTSLRVSYSRLGGLVEADRVPPLNLCRV